MKTLLRLLVSALIFAGSALPAAAQTAAVTPTLSQAVLTLDPVTLLVSSTSGITGFSGGQPAFVCLLDREIVNVRTVINTTSMTVTRAAFSTRAAMHATGSTLVCNSPASVQTYLPSGQCTRTSLPFVPIIIGGAPGLGDEVGGTYDCLGLTTAGQYVRTDTNGKTVLGATVASPAGVMTLSGTFMKVSGTNAVTGITAPAGVGPGFCFTIEPTGAFTTTTATNIVITSTAVVGKLLTFCWDGAATSPKWVPSY